MQAADGTSQRLATLLDTAAEAGLWRDGRGPALLADLCSGIEQPHQAWPVYEAMLKHSAPLPAAEHKVHVSHNSSGYMTCARDVVTTLGSSMHGWCPGRILYLHMVRQEQLERDIF